MYEVHCDSISLNSVKFGRTRANRTNFQCSDLKSLQNTRFHFYEGVINQMYGWRLNFSSSYYDVFLLLNLIVRLLLLLLKLFEFLHQPILQLLLSCSHRLYILCLEKPNLCKIMRWTQNTIKLTFTCDPTLIRFSRMI